MATTGFFAESPDVAVFADTHAEPPEVYKWLDWLSGRLSFPVFRVSAGSLIEHASQVTTSKSSGRTHMSRDLPVFFWANGQRNLSQRRCTQNFKIDPIRKFTRQFFAEGVEQWIGISTDEAHRMKDSNRKYIVNRFPLIELGMTRDDCKTWMREHNFPEPPKSSCFFCPYHSDAQWLQLKTRDPDLFSKACDFEEHLQKTQLDRETDPYLGYFHRTMKPLRNVEFSHERQPDLFGNDCTGMCGN